MLSPFFAIRIRSEAFCRELPHRTGGARDAGTAHIVSVMQERRNSAGHIYIGNASDSIVRMFDTFGHLLTSFGQAGIQAGELLSPAGLWIDSANKVYVADERNRRVQVFQLASSETMNEKATAQSGTRGIPVDDQANSNGRQ